MISDLWIYGTLALSSILNIIVPISGSATVTPFLAILTDPHRAIGLASFYFFLTALVRLILFRKDIQWKEVKILLIPSMGMSAIGAAALVGVPDVSLLIVVFLFTIYFLYKRIYSKKDSKSSLTDYVVGLLSGFLQGAGLAGSDLRNGYLYSQGLNISQVHGTTALIGGFNFFVATAVRLNTGQLDILDLTPLIYVLPFIIFGVLIGRYLLYKLPQKVSDIIVILTMLLVLVFLGIKILKVV